MSLANMVTRRVKKVIAWVLAIVVLALLAAGVVFVVTRAGVV